MKPIFRTSSQLFSRYMRGSLRQALTRKFVLYLLLSTGTVQADSANIIYYQAPPAEEIADILFQPRYRGIVIKEEAASTPQKNVFGMLINFEFDSVKILPDSLPMLDAVGRMMRLKQTAGKRIVIEGHADAVGKSSYNQNLSERRARAIRRYLISRFQIDSSRLVAIGKGERDPHDRTNPSAAVNRRVQFRPLT